MALLAAATPVQADSHRQPPRVATVDWTLAETLMALGVTPVAVGQIADYNAWVEQPKLPETVVDLGLRAQPNRELIASLNLDHFLLSPLFLALKPSLSRITPVTTLATYKAESSLWHNLVNTTRQLATLINRPEQAATLVSQTRERLQQVRRQLPPDAPAMLVVQFIDNRHVRVYGQGSLYDMVLERLELENAWTGNTNAWGYSMAGLQDLTTGGYLVLVDPLPMGVRGNLEQNRIWQALPAVRRNQVLRLPAVWSFGGLPSAARFAEELGEALATSHNNSGGRDGS